MDIVTINNHDVGIREYDGQRVVTFEMIEKLHGKRRGSAGKRFLENKEHFIPGKHSNKSNLCREKGIKLLHIREDLWNRDKEKMKQIILKFLNT